MAGIAWYAATALLSLGAFAAGWAAAGGSKKRALGTAAVALAALLSDCSFFYAFAFRISIASSTAFARCFSIQAYRSLLFVPVGL